MIFAFYSDMMFKGFVYAGLISAFIFLIASVSDFLDGLIARKYGLITTTGKFLDPIADKLLVITALFLTVEAGLIASPYGAVAASVIVARELTISGLRQIGAAKGVVISADKSGKIKAVFQYITMTMFLLQKTFDIVLSGTLLDIYLVLAYISLAGAVILTVYSWIDYILKNKSVLRNF
jgi:CDP-diacylglycerol--glycerol-3-phosphate 3-phosphatidyltransferase